MQLVGWTAQAAARKLRRASLNVFIVVGGLRDGAATANVRLAVREHERQTAPRARLRGRRPERQSRRSRRPGQAAFRCVPARVELTGDEAGPAPPDAQPLLGRPHGSLERDRRPGFASLTPRAGHRRKGAVHLRDARRHARRAALPRHHAGLATLNIRL